MLSRKQRVCSSFVALLCTLAFGGLSCINVNAEGESETKFEGVGHYAFATAGNNNYYHGDTYETSGATRRIITPEDNDILPDNWEAVEAKLNADGYEINNLSGSYLDFTGVVKYAEVDYFKLRSSCGQGDTAEERAQSTNPINLILISESGDYTVVTDMHHDVTDFINKAGNGSGWYFASYYTPLVQGRCSQASWALTAVYEDDSLDNSFIELINPNMIFNSGSEDTYDRMFKTGLTITDEAQLIGVYVGAGTVAWSAYTEQYNTSDETYAILADGSIKQLYETQYGGRTIFEGRTNTDFAQGVFNTRRSHDIPGGEVDIFDETLGSDFFGNKEVVGYRVHKVQPAIYLEPVLFGLRKGVEAPDVEVEPTIPSEDPEHPEIIIRNTSNHNACGLKMVLPLEQISDVTEVVLEPSENIQYEIRDDNLIVTYNGTLRAGRDITVSLTTEKQIGSVLMLEPEVAYFPASNGVCTEEIMQNDMFKKSAYGEDMVYRVLAKYVDEDGKELAESEYSYARIGDEYETSEKVIKGYSLKQMPENKSGTVSNGDVTIVYVYEADVAVPNTGGIIEGEKAIKGAVMVGMPIIFGGIGVVVHKYLERRNKKVQFNK